MTSSGMSLGLTTEYRDWSYSCGREHSHRPADTKKHESKFVNEARTKQQQQQQRQRDADTFDCLRRRDDDDRGTVEFEFPDHPLRGSDLAVLLPMMGFCDDCDGHYERREEDDARRTILL